MPPKKKIPFDKIEPGKTYSLHEIINLRLIPGVKNYPAMLRRVVKDYLLPPEQRTLQALKLGSGGATRYYIKGENLIAYLKTYEGAKQGK